MQSVRDDVCWYTGVADDGSIVAICADRSAADLVLQRWPPRGLTRSDDPIETADLRLVVSQVTTDGAAVVSVNGQPAWGGLDRLESELALFAAERLAGLIAIHAALIVREDRALLVPGASGAGKSTLCLAAAATAAKVLTDEYALVDPRSGMVTGWRRPVRIRRPDGGVDRLDLTVASDPLPVGLVALVSHHPAPGQGWAPVRSAEAVLGLLANTVCARSRPDEALDAALAIGRSAPAVAGTRGEATPAVVELLDLLDSHTAVC